MTKVLYEAKCQWLINKRESVGLKHCNDTKAFIEYPNDINDIYENITKHNTKWKIKKYWLYLMIWLLIRVVTRNPEPKVIGMFLRSRTFLLFVLQNFIL